MEDLNEENCTVVNEEEIPSELKIVDTKQMTNLGTTSEKQNPICSTEYYCQVQSLNENLIRWMKFYLSENACYDLSAVFDDYQSYFNTLNAIYPASIKSNDWPNEKGSSLTSSSYTGQVPFSKNTNNNNDINHGLNFENSLKNSDETDYEHNFKSITTNTSTFSSGIVKTTETSITSGLTSSLIDESAPEKELFQSFTGPNTKDNSKSDKYHFSKPFFHTTSPVEKTTNIKCTNTEEPEFSYKLNTMQPGNSYDSNFSRQFPFTTSVGNTTNIKSTNADEPELSYELNSTQKETSYNSNLSKPFPFTKSSVEETTDMEFSNVEESKFSCKLNEQGDSNLSKSFPIIPLSAEKTTDIKSTNAEEPKFSYEPNSAPQGTSSDSNLSKPFPFTESSVEETTEMESTNAEKPEFSYELDDTQQETSYDSNFSRPSSFIEFSVEKMTDIECTNVEEPEFSYEVNSTQQGTSSDSNLSELSRFTATSGEKRSDMASTNAEEPECSYEVNNTQQGTSYDSYFSRPFTTSSVEKLGDLNYINKEEPEYAPPKKKLAIMKEENLIYSKKCELYFVKDYTYIKRGVGTLYLKKIDGNFQLLIKADTKLDNVLLDIVLDDSLPVSLHDENNVILMCVPNPPLDSEKADVNEAVPMLIRVNTSKEAEELFEILIKYTF